MLFGYWHYYYNDTRVSRSTLQLRRPPKQHTHAALTTLNTKKNHERYLPCYSCFLPFIPNCDQRQSPTPRSADRPHPTTLTNTFSAGKP